MHESSSSLLNGFVRIVLSIFAVPLLLGGLIAAGEIGDARVLMYGIVALIALASISRPRVSVEPSEEA
jgi:type VI protein secretion system component VasK